MFLKKTILSCLFFIQNIKNLLAECWIRYKNTSYTLPSKLRDPKAIFCKVGLEVCCSSDGCCNSSSHYTIYPYIWEIIVTAMLIFMSLLVCACTFYYCKYSFQKAAFLRNVNGQEVGSEANSQGTPPPTYDIAILLPRVNPGDRVPTYEEAVSKERF